MVGIVIVSHSEKLAEGVVEVSKMMVPDAVVIAAGGMEDGGLGTSFDKIAKAVEEAERGDGVIIIMDMGSAVMTAEMVVEAYPDKKIVLADCPIVEGAISGSVTASMNAPMDAVLEAIAESKEYSKIE